MATTIKSGIYKYEYDKASHRLKVSVLRGRSMPVFKLGDFEVKLSTRRTKRPKEYVGAVTGKANAVKGFMPTKIPAVCDYVVRYNTFNPKEEATIFLPNGKDENGVIQFETYHLTIPETDNAEFYSLRKTKTKLVTPAVLIDGVLTKIFW